MTQQNLTASDGHSFSAYHAPAAGLARGGLVVVQEIFGVNSHIRSVADGYAADGYEVLAPPLFDRVERGVELDYSPDSIQRGIELAGRLGARGDNPVEGLAGCLRDIEACADWLRSQHLKVGLVGYCFGGTLAWLGSSQLKLDAAVGYYGGMIQQMLHLAPSCPIMLHFGERDAHIPPEAVDAIASAYPELPIFGYPAGHGFNCDQRDSFDGPSAELARRRTLDFFGQHLA